MQYNKSSTTETNEDKMISFKQFKYNFNQVELGSLKIWFSYETPIAFQSFGQIFIRKNDWGPTTGKHLNSIDTDKKRRLSGLEFEKLLNHNVNLATTEKRWVS